MTELPASYGRTRLVLLEVDPQLVHAYWEVTAEDRRDAAKRLDEGKAPARWIVRFYEISTSESEGAADQTCFDVSVDLAPGNWYVKVPGAGKSYRAELGPISSSGRFRAACSSNTVKTARADASPRFQPKWLEVHEAFTVMRRVPEPRSESAAQNRTAAGPEKPAVREVPAPPFILTGRRAHAEEHAPKREAAGVPGAASAGYLPSREVAGMKAPAQSGSPPEGLSSSALGDPERKCAGVGPASDTEIKRSD